MASELILTLLQGWLFLQGGVDLDMTRNSVFLKYPNATTTANGNCSVTIGGSHTLLVQFEGNNVIRIVFLYNNRPLTPLLLSTKFGAPISNGRSLIWEDNNYYVILTPTKSGGMLIVSRPNKFKK